MEEADRRRSLGVLVLAQALGLSGAPLVVMVGGIVGRDLAPSPSLATLPLATMVVGTAVGAGPAALLMRRVGRRRGFASGAAVAAIGALLATAAVRAGSFALFALATLLVGVNLAFVMQYRFAAAELGRPGEAGRAVALVLAGGIAAGILGPELAQWTRDGMATPWAGSFLALAAVYAVLTLVLVRGLRGGPVDAPAARAGRPRRVRLPDLRQPSFLLAAGAAVTAYAGMTLVMTATPLAMHGAGHPPGDTALVIQSHVVAMYAPSLLAAALVARLGLPRLLALGLAAMMACAALGVLAEGLAAYLAALVLLGVGWNLLFLGGTVVLARAFPGEERFGIQAVNDVLVFGVQAVASLGAGALLHRLGWVGLNWAALSVLASLGVALALVGGAGRRRARGAAAAEAAG